ncbi:glycosyltransferase family 2 protein [Chloroflexota bacterium]
MISKPTVSVVIPTYNRAYLLGNAIRSVLSQTYKDFEMIIVDDGSTDNTEEVVKGFADKRIRYVRLKKNSGSCATPRNAGIKIAQGEYIACQDDDSEWLPEKLEKHINAFEKASPAVGVTYTGMWRITDNEKTYWPPACEVPKEGNIHQQLLKQCYIGNPPVVVKKECLKRVGMYDEKLPFALEWDLWLRVSKYYDFKFIDEPLVTAYYSPETTHYNETNIMKGIIMLLDKHLREFKEADKILLTERYFNCGAALCISEDSAQFAEGRRSILTAAKICPLNLKYILFSLISLSGPALFHNRPLRRLYRRLNRKS